MTERQIPFRSMRYVAAGTAVNRMPGVKPMPGHGQMMGHLTRVLRPPPRVLSQDRPQLCSLEVGLVRPDLALCNAEAVRESRSPERGPRSQYLPRDVLRQTVLERMRSCALLRLTGHR